MSHTNDYMRTSKYLSIWFYLILATLTLSTPAAAESDNFWMANDRVGFTLGGFFPSFDSEVRVTNDDGEGTLVSLEDDLGLDDSLGAFRLSGHYRFNSRHRFMYSAFKMSRDSSETITRDLVIGDETYTAGTVLKSEAEVLYFTLLYGYSFYQTDKIDLAVSGGIVGLDAETKLESDVTGSEKGEEFLP